MSASLFIPSHPNHYGVILTHGAGGDMNHAQLVSFATALAEVGFLVLRFTCKGLNIKYRSKVYLTVLVSEKICKSLIHCPYSQKTHIDVFWCVLPHM